MAGGPVHPSSTFPVTVDKVFASQYVGPNDDRQEIGLGVLASLDADGIWRLRFDMPEVLPLTGSPKIRMRLLADAITGVSKINVKWKSVAEEADIPRPADLTAETVQTTTWATGDNIQNKALTVALDGTTAPAAKEILCMDLTFETSGWTLAQILTVVPKIIWE